MTHITQAFPSTLFFANSFIAKMHPTVRTLDFVIDVIMVTSSFKRMFDHDKHSFFYKQKREVKWRKICHFFSFDGHEK